MWLASAEKKQRNALLNMRRGRNGEMENRLMVFKRAKNREDAVIDGVGDLVFVDDGAICFGCESKATEYKNTLCHASKQDIFSCLTDEEIDAEYRRRLIGKKVAFADAPLGSHVLVEGEKCKVVLKPDGTGKAKAIKFCDEQTQAWPLDWDVVFCEPPEQKKNEELSDLIKSMEEMIEIAKKHLEGEE